jgi:hypothetical protein
VGHNTGNLAFCYAINRTLGGNLKTANWSDEPKTIDSFGSIGILTLANQLGSHANMAGSAKSFAQLKCNLVGIGLGAQANNFQQDVKVPQGTLDWVRVIQEHSYSAAPNIAMRGEFSRQTLEKYNLADKTVVLGCPTLFISPDKQLGASIASKFTGVPKRIAIAAGHPNWHHLAKIETSLVQMANLNRGGYICQSHLEMIQLGRGESRLLSQETRTSCRSYINPQLTDEDFIDWCNLNALSFFSASAWLEYIRRYDFVIGTRIHGVALALQVGVPALCITHDSRTKELCETMKVPYVEAKDVMTGITAQDIPRLFKFDPEEFDKNRRNLAEGYIKFLTTNGLKPANYLRMLTVSGTNSVNLENDPVSNLQETLETFTSGKTAFESAKVNCNRTMGKYIAGFNGFAKISHTPKFKFKKGTKFFTIGSCFARNVENYLRNSDFQLLSEMPVLSGSYYELSGGKDRTGYQNVYTPSSVLEVVRLISAENKYHSIVGEGEQYFDLLTSGLLPLPNEKVKEIRKGLLKTYANLPDADVLFVTLGYNESWFYVPCNSFINVAPAHIILRRKIDDFKFCSFDFSDVSNMIDEVIVFVHQLNPDCKIVLTVSPVPLSSTFSRTDVIVANQKSKAILLAVATEMAAKYDFVDYFPSYEIIINSEYTKVFESDGVHVKNEGVKKVMEIFFSAYF